MIAVEDQKVLIREVLRLSANDEASGPGDDWDGIELLLGDKQDDDWINFVSQETPDCMYDHWQNMYEADKEYRLANPDLYEEDR